MPREAEWALRFGTLFARRGRRAGVYAGKPVTWRIEMKRRFFVGGTVIASLGVLAMLQPVSLAQEEKAAGHGDGQMSPEEMAAMQAESAKIM